MKGIAFGDYHSYRDLKLLLQPGKEIGSPEVKQKMIAVDGADGSLDYTDFFGEPKYNHVTLKFPFAAILPKSEFLTHYSLVKNALHGKKMRIILDDDPASFYVGRVFVGKYTNDKNIGMITIECDCEPYKYKISRTVVSRAIDGAETVILTNARKRAVPEVRIDTESTLNIRYQDNLIWDLGPGSYTLPELELMEGDNAVSVTGTGTIAFEWQEGSL